MMTKGITLVVCCYNSEKRLAPTIEHIAKQKTNPDLQWELLIIDNLSTDNTAKVAMSLWDRFKSATSMRVIKEETPGLSNARKRAVMESTFDYILFCDDDNWLDENYVQRGFDVINSDEKIGIVGGKGFPEFEAEPPKWFKSVHKSYALGAQAKSSGYISGHNIYGAGMLMRKAVLKDLYGLNFKSILTGRNGKNLTTGEEIEICLWYKKSGFRFYYDERLTFRHYIPASRLTTDFFLKRTIGKGKTEAVFLIYNKILDGDGQVRWLESNVVWYYEILKRLLHYVSFRIKGITNFEDRVMSTFLLSAIDFRLKNHDYLKTCADQVRQYKELIEQR